MKILVDADACPVKEIIGSMTTTIWINCCLNAILDRRSGGLVEGPLGRKSVRAQMMNPLKELL